MLDDVAIQIGARIRTARKSKGLSQEKLAEMCGMHPTYIGQVERGEKNVTVINVYRIAEALGVGLEDLFQGIGKQGQGRGSILFNEIVDILSGLSESKQQSVIKILRDIVTVAKQK